MKRKVVGSILKSKLPSTYYRRRGKLTRDDRMARILHWLRSRSIDSKWFHIFCNLRHYACAFGKKMDFFSIDSPQLLLEVVPAPLLPLAYARECAYLPARDQSINDAGFEAFVARRPKRPPGREFRIPSNSIFESLCSHYNRDLPPSLRQLTWAMSPKLQSLSVVRTIRDLCRPCKSQWEYLPADMAREELQLMFDTTIDGIVNRRAPFNISTSERHLMSIWCVHDVCAFALILHERILQTFSVGARIQIPKFLCIMARSMDDSELYVRDGKTILKTSIDRLRTQYSSQSDDDMTPSTDDEMTPSADDEV